MIIEKPLPEAPQTDESLSLPPPYQPSPRTPEFASASSSGYNHHHYSHLNPYGPGPSTNNNSSHALGIVGGSSTNFATSNVALAPVMSAIEAEDDLTRPSFSRSPPSALPPPFMQEIFLVARSDLDKGFPLCAPPFIPTNEPQYGGGPPFSHPFVSRDVREDDWARFLTDIKFAASLTENQRQQAHNIPIVSAIPIVSLVASSTAKAVMKSQRKKVAARVVDRWNHHFFRPRGLECVLTEGRTRLSGNKGAPLPNSFGSRCERDGMPGEEEEESRSLEVAPNRTSNKLEKSRDAAKRRKAEKKAYERDWADKKASGAWIPDDGAFRLFVLAARS